MASISPTSIAPVVQLHPTRRCNLACAHCYTTSGPHNREELPAELLSQTLDAAAELGYRQLALSGGEPLLYRELREVLAHARRLGMITTVTTNGMLASGARWDALAPLLDVVAVSIDGMADEHDAMRRQRGAFAHTVRNLDVIRDSGVPFGFIFTLTRFNADSLDDVVRLAARSGARSVQVHPLTNFGRAVTDLPDTRPDAIELAVALIEAARLGAALGVAVHVDAVTREQLQSFRAHFVPSRPVRDLTAVAPVLVVNASGVVVPLTHELHPSLHMGSIRHARLDVLCRDWIASGAADRLALACEEAWTALTDAGEPAAVYWYEEVASRTAPAAPRPSGRTSGL